MTKPKHKILYVDDEEQNLFAFKASFRREYEVFTAPGAAEGMELLRQEDIKLIIADQRMPETTGVSFLTQAKLEFPKPIRMILTGYSDVAAVIEAINSGHVYGYLTKPWDKDEMRTSVQSAIDFYDLQAENLKLFDNLDITMQDLKQTLRRFKQYIPESVVQDALKASEEALIVGERRDVAVLFCDMRNFTPLSEKLEPEDVVTLLNEYYTLMTQVVLNHKGIVAQFIGDEVFAVFGAPMRDDNKELNAVYCAIDMIEKSVRLNEKFADLLPGGLKFGVGVNCGYAVVGNVGSEQRITYSIIGDIVNTAKRIETLTRDHPNTILIRDSVYEKVTGHIDLKPWEPISVKGKAQKIQVYEVLGRKVLAN